MTVRILEARCSRCGAQREWHGSKQDMKRKNWTVKHEGMDCRPQSLAASFATTVRVTWIERYKKVSSC